MRVEANELRRRRWWAPLALLAVSGLLSLAVLEIGARVLRLSNVGTPYVREDPDTIYSHIPGKRGRMESPGEFAVRFAINSKGLRSPEIDYPRTGRERVLAIGDSFTFGIGADDDETWPALLDAALGAGSPSEFETLNAGVRGWGLAEYWIWLEKEGVRYRPDWIVLGIHASDWTSPFRGLVSLGEAGDLEKHRREAAGIDRLKEASAKIPLYETLMNWSVFANYLKGVLARQLRGGTTQGLEAGDDEPPQARFERAWPINRALLLAIERQTAELGAKLALVFIPTYQHIVGEAGHEGVEQRFRDALAQHADARELAFVDMTSHFRAAAAQPAATIGDFYHPDDGHCTPLGYAEIARSAAEIIRDDARSRERHGG